MQKISNNHKYISHFVKMDEQHKYAIMKVNNCRTFINVLS